MKTLLKFSLPFLMACATGPSFSGGKVTPLDPMKTTCTPFDFQPTSVDADSAKQVPGACLGKDYLYEVQDKDKVFSCTATSKPGAMLGFAFDVLGVNPTTYEYRVVPQKVDAPIPANGILPIAPGSENTPFISGSTRGSQRVIISAKSPAVFDVLQIKAPVGTVLGPLCWQLPAQNVE